MQLKWLVCEDWPLNGLCKTITCQIAVKVSLASFMPRFSTNEWCTASECNHAYLIIDNIDYITGIGNVIDHSSSTYGNLIPDPTPKRRKGSGTHRALSGACWHGISEFYRTNQIHAMWLAHDYHVTQCDSQLKMIMELFVTISGFSFAKSFMAGAVDKKIYTEI